MHGGNIMIAFGPVPSRRLGRSLGINNIPPKVCSYSCIYCQVGRTLNIQTECQSFFTPEKILQEVSEAVKMARQAGETIDYLIFVPDGEPTLNENLGRSIAALRLLGRRIAVVLYEKVFEEESRRVIVMVLCPKRDKAINCGWNVSDFRMFVN
jgi:wyosine [tRNA(Phe)-imidazoG37] synthetase (radical SAM superfamily)